MTALTLYHLPACPFCLKVRAAAEALGIELELVDVSRDREARALLLRTLGRATVPVLRLPGEPHDRLLPESDDIVAYLRTHAAQLRTVA